SADVEPVSVVHVCADRFAGVEERQHKVREVEVAVRYPVERTVLEDVDAHAHVQGKLRLLLVRDDPSHRISELASTVETQDPEVDLLDSPVRRDRDHVAGSPMMFNEVADVQ